MSPDSPPPVIILGLSGSAVGALRSLRPFGADVYGVYSDPSVEVARHSRFLKARYRISDTRSNTEILNVLRSIRKQARSPAKIVLLPTDDTFARFVSSRRDTLQDDYLFRAPPPTIGEAFLDKRATVDICRRYGMPIPASFVPDTPDDIARMAGACRYPVIIKPAATDDGAFPGKNVVAGTAAELLTFYRRRTELVPRSMFQELIPSGDGHIVTVTSYSDIHGSVVAQLSSRKLRQWLPDTGTGCFSVSETHPRLLKRTRKFLEDIGFVGFSSIDFAEDAQHDEYRFLELNARLTNRNRQQADAGIDLAAIAYLEMCGNEPPRDLVQQDGVYWVDLHRDIPSFVLKWLRHELTFGEWLASVRRANSFAILDRADPNPFIASVCRMFAVAGGLTSARQAGPIGSLLRSRRARAPRGPEPGRT